MLYLHLLQLFTTCLLTYLSAIKPRGLFDIKEYARIAYSRPPPPPPPQLFFRTSADFADEYHLLSRANLSVTMPSRLFNNNPDSFQIPADTENTFLKISSWPSIFDNVLHCAVKMGLCFVSAAAKVFISSLHLFAATGSPATAAYVLRQQLKQDWSNFRMRSLLPSWGLARTVDKQRRYIRLLGAQLQRTEKKRAILRGKFLEVAENFQENQAELFLQRHLVSVQQQELETLYGRVEQKTKEGDVLREVRNGLLTSLEVLRVDRRDNEDIIRHLQATVERQDARIKRREDDLETQQEDSSAKFTSYELQIAATNDNLQAVTADAATRQAQADERIRELEEQDKSGREAAEKAAEKAEADLKAARENIERLQSTIRSNSLELQMYRDRARQQAQHRSTPPFRPAPMPIPQGQAPFAPRPTQIPGFPPNRTSGFVGNALPSGRGRGRGGSGGAR